MVIPINQIPRPRDTVTDMLAAKGVALGAAVHGIGPQETVYAAIQKMTETRVGALVVMDGGRLVGIVSERDYARKVILQGRASKDTPVSDIMTAKVLTVSPATQLAECMQIVADYGIRHLPVVEGERVLGVLSVGDLLRAVLVQQSEQIEKLNSFIGSDYPT